MGGWWARNPKNVIFGQFLTIFGHIWPPNSPKYGLIDLKICTCVEDTIDMNILKVQNNILKIAPSRQKEIRFFWKNKAIFQVQFTPWRWRHIKKRTPKSAFRIFLLFSKIKSVLVYLAQKYSYQVPYFRCVDLRFRKNGQLWGGLGTSQGGNSKNKVPSPSEEPYSKLTISIIRDHYEPTTTESPVTKGTGQKQRFLAFFGLF